jgi:hypothetical protein
LIFSIVLSSALVLNGYVYAESVVYLEKNKPAPYSGVLFPSEKADELRKMAIEVETLRAINESYNKSIQLYRQTITLSDEKFKLLETQNERLSVSLVESRRSNDLQKILWFSLGVLATGLAVYGAKQITR